MTIPFKVENVDDINKWLVNKYGYFDVDKPNWRVVWSEDLLEKRFGTFRDHSPEGLFLREFTGVREVRKYQHIKDKYVLERILDVTAFNRSDTVDKTSYEPVWTFRDAHDNALAPRISVCYYIIETVYENAAKRVGVKYKHPYHDMKTQKDVKEQELMEIYGQLYGNEDAVATALSQRRAITVPELPLTTTEKEPKNDPAI